VNINIAIHAGLYDPVISNIEATNIEPNVSPICVALLGEYLFKQNPVQYDVELDLGVKY
jgi:hypothetical protein